jgi:hypothetical protein
VPVGPVILAAVLLLAAGGYARGEAILVPSQGQVPNDSSGKVSITIADETDFDGRYLKVSFVDGGSFGQSRPPIADWRRHETLKFEVVNPEKMSIMLSLAIKHKGSRDFGTRADSTRIVKPGRQHITVPLKGLKDNNGSASYLSAVGHWYIACAQKKTVLYFGDFILSGGETLRPQPATTAAHGRAARAGHTLPAISKPGRTRWPVGKVEQGGLLLNSHMGGLWIRIRWK